MTAAGALPYPRTALAAAAPCTLPSGFGDWAAGTQPENDGICRPSGVPSTGENIYQAPSTTEKPFELRMAEIVHLRGAGVAVGGAEISDLVQATKSSWLAHTVARQTACSPRSR